MTVTDPISDMLTRLRNAVMAKHDTVIVPKSRMKAALADVLLSEGYVARVEDVTGAKWPTMRIYLKYADGRDRVPVLRGLERVSKPGCRVYAGKAEIPMVQSGMGSVILSTSQGIMTGRKASQLGVGGEVICKVW